MNIQIRRVIFGFLLLFTCTVVVHAANNKFKVRFKVIDGQANQIKNELDYKLAKSLDFCRGHYIATRKSKWSCSQTKSKVISCESFFKCSNVTKNFTREGQQKRLAKKLIKANRKNIYKIYVSKLPIGLKVKNSSHKTIANRKSVQAKQISKPLVFEKEGIELFNDDGHKDKDTTDEFVKNESSEENVDSLLLEMDDEEVIEKVTDAPESSFKLSDLKKKLNLLSFSLQYVSTKNDESTSYQSFGFSYIPTLEVIDSLFIRPELGFHKFTFESESSLVLSTIFHIDYVFKSGIFLSAGYGKQKWSSENLDDVSFSGLHYGAGYYSKKKFLGLVDRIFIDLASLTSSDATTTAAEFKVGFGMSF